MILPLVWITGAWLWSGGEMLYSIFTKGFSSDAAPGIWLVVLMWAVAAACLLLVLCWHLAGKEVLSVEGRELVLKSVVPPFSRAKRYEAGAVRELRALEVSSWGYWPSSRPAYGRRASALAFDYGATTIRFGASLDEAEAKLLVKEIGQRHPDLVRPI